MMTLEQIAEKWDSLEIRTDSSIHQRVDAEHPIDIYIGVSPGNEKELLIISETEPQNVNRLKSMLIEIRKRSDGKFVVIFKLTDQEQEAVFVNLVHDLIESSRDQLNDQKGISFIIERFIKWQRLLEEGRGGLLSDTMIKGLTGELLFLEHTIKSGLDALTAVKGWVGIQKAARDFVYFDKWYEIKSVNPSATAVHISSVEQLDIDMPGELVVFFIEKSVEIEEGSYHLNHLVGRLRSLLQQDLRSLREFNEKLFDFGYQDRSEYSNKYFICRHSKRFLVDHDFPRVRKNDLFPAVCRLSYDLSLNAIAQWEL